MSDPPLLALPVLKFSHATNINADEKDISWTHITQSNMFLVVEDQLFSSNAQQLYPGKSLQITHGRDVLEHLPLEYLCNAARALSRETQPRNVQLLQNQRSIFAIVKNPCVALRYRQHDGKTRRIQVRLSDDADYNELVNVLTAFGCTISQPQQTVQRPSCPPSALNQLPGRPIVSAGGSSLNQPSSFSFQTEETQVLRSRPSTATGQTNIQTHPRYTPDGYNYNPRSRPNNQEHQLVRPHTSTSAFPPYPSTSHGQRSLQPSPLSENTVHAPAPASPTRDTMLQSPQRTYSNLRPTFGSTPHGPSRPATAPAAKQPASLASIIPPRRELPFESKRPLSRQAKAAAGGSSALTLPTISGSSDPARPAPRNHHLPSDDRTQAPLSSATTRPFHTPRPAPHDLKNVNFKRPLSARSSNIPSSTSAAAPASTSVTVNPTIDGNLNADTLSHANLTGLAAILGGGSNSSRDDDEKDDMVTAAAVKRRRVVMQDLICRYLANNDFLRLAEEVEGEWRRIGGGF